MCQHVLVVDSTNTDDESVIGEECHIVSGAAGGPRFDSKFPKDEVDSLGNLLLLCRIHHKQVDDQSVAFSASVLRVIKEKHEAWVHETLESRPQEAPSIAPVRCVRFKKEIPAQLPLVTSGKALLDLALGCFGQYPHFGDDLNEEEVDLVGGFLEAIRDWVDVLDGSEVIETMKAARTIDDMIKDLASHGFFVFAAVERQRLEGGVSPPQIIRLLHLSVVRSSDNSVVIKEPTDGPDQV
jgi:HNH endonuclease